MNILERWQTDKPESTAEQTVFEFINELIDRQGFDMWWDNIDEEIKIEILESLVENIGKIHD